jgi:REP element-mobilizing transposase RayT
MQTAGATMRADKYKGKYRISSARLASWDYGSNAAYFITICTHGRAHAFGEVVDGEVRLTALGQAAWDCWYAIPEHFPFVLLDEFVAMPNHVHGIVIIDKPLPAGVDAADAADVVETQNFASLPRHRRPVSDNQPKNRFGPQSQNLASIVRGFKIGVTKYARQHQIEFAWQARYYDHIVRNAADYQRIRTYIVENPKKWAADTFHT